MILKLKIQGDSMGEGNMIINDLFIQILSGLIIAAIIGASTSFFVLYKCVHKQAVELKKAKTAFAVIVRLFVTESKRLHPEESEELLEIEEIYKELMNEDN